MRKNYYSICTKCGAHLDPGEKCDCENNRNQTRCLYCGKVIDDCSICGCNERKNALQEDIQNAKRNNITLNEDIGLHEIMKVLNAGESNLDSAYIIYKLGLIRGMRRAKAEAL